ncbi:MAG: peptidase M14 [Cyclobacteriaceae bacterium]|nr:peptidase M14 [Cyclobacteriaceae bacterium]
MKVYLVFFYCVSLCISLSVSTVRAQAALEGSLILDVYDQIREPLLHQRRFSHSEMVPLVEKLRHRPGIQVNKVGQSLEGRSIHLISIGKGPVRVLCWSQMHGDEPTATMALFDLFNFFSDDDAILIKEKQAILEKITLYAIPMLNPDGAERFQRRTALDIDMNRDALRLQNPESRLLKSIRDSLKADIGFNLHDQGRGHSVGFPPRPAVISLLAPAYNEVKDINEVRLAAMQVCASIYDNLKHHIPGQIGLYDDTFEPRAFGDNMQKWGTSTILIESGGMKGDPEKQFVRKLNFLAMVGALASVASDNYKKFGLEDYKSIPPNDFAMMDLIIREAVISYMGNDFTVDLGIRIRDIAPPDSSSLYRKAYIADIGDLSTFAGYVEINAKGMHVKAASYVEINKEELSFIRDFASWLEQGIGFVTGDESVQESMKGTPFIFISEAPPQSQDALKIGDDATFILEKNDQLKYTLVNGAIFHSENKQFYDLDGNLQETRIK